VQTSDWGEIWSKVVALVEIFPTVYGMPLESKEIMEIPDF
jgi:hypothetical protein